jgi:hypothetical protein
MIHQASVSETKTTTFKKTSMRQRAGGVSPQRARKKSRQLSVVLAVFYRAWPLAGLALALAATVGCITILDYVGA